MTTFTKISLLLFTLALTCLYLSTTEARSIRKRQSSPHIQLHRRRRYLQRMYDELLAIYQFINLQENPESKAPVQINFNNPETDVVRNVMRRLRNKEDSWNVNVRKDGSPYHNRRRMETPVDFSSSIERLSEEQRNGLPGRQSTIDLGNGFQMRVQHSLNLRDQQEARRNKLLLQRVLELCHIVNNKVGDVSLGVKVKTCTLL